MNIQSIKEMLFVVEGLGKALKMEVKKLEVVTDKGDFIMRVDFTDNLPFETTVTYYINDDLLVEKGTEMLSDQED